MKTIEQVHYRSSSHWVGDGFPVRSVFDYKGLGRELSPFLLMDYAAPHDFPADNRRRGVGAHPHKGFETVTVVYQGELEHRDSTGAGGLIGPGDVQWMTAGRGIIHEEFHSPRFAQSGGTLEMVQLWVNLRAADKNAAPGYQSLAAADIPTAPLEAGNGTVRVIAGSLNGHLGPARTFSPIDLWDISIPNPCAVNLPGVDGHTTALLVLRGEARFPGDRQAMAGDLVVFSRKGDTIFWNASEDSRFLLLAGEPFNEPIVGQGPFVMNTRDEIAEAYSQYQSGTFAS